MTGEQLKATREAMALSQAELALLLGRTTAALARFENAKQVPVPIAIGIKALTDKLARPNAETLAEVFIEIAKLKKALRRIEQKLGRKRDANDLYNDRDPTP